MGIDLRIEFRGTPLEHTYHIGRIGTIVPLADYKQEDNPEATHEIDSLVRYYGIGYERGPWPAIAACLMELMQDPGIEKVWYGGDDFISEMTADRLIEITRHYIANGDRPYRNAFRDLNIPNYQPKTT